MHSSLLERNRDPTSWNYGNIVYRANQVLGRVALREEKVADAKQYLLKAGRTPGSPQLNSFGPQFFLARELLERAEIDIVLENLDLVRTFWKGAHLVELEQWKKEIREGKIPISANWH